MRFEAASWQTEATRHPNKLGFSGVLVRIGVPSDAAPHGSGGRRVVLSAAAAARAIPTLHNMPVNLSADMDRHSTLKIGVITNAKICGAAIEVSGTIWAADHPAEAMRIHAAQDRLGMSFEASGVRFVDAAADPLVISELTFSGASILAKSAAAYQDTACAILASKQRERLPIEEGLRMAASGQDWQQNIQGIKDENVKLEASGPVKFAPTLQAAAAGEGRYIEDNQLRTLMAQASITHAADVDRLDEAQLNRMMENKTISQRIEIQTRVMRSGLYPRTLPVARRVSF